MSENSDGKGREDWLYAHTFLLEGILTNNQIICSWVTLAVDEHEPTPSMARTIRVAKVEIGRNQIAVIQVPSFALYNPQEADRLTQEYSELLPEHTIVLMGMTGLKKTYFGEPELTEVLLRTPHQRFPWIEMTTD